MGANSPPQAIHTHYRQPGACGSTKGGEDAQPHASAKHIRWIPYPRCTDRERYFLHTEVVQLTFRNARIGAG